MGALIIFIDNFGTLAGAKGLYLINNWTTIQNGVEVSGLLLYGGILFLPIYMFCISNFFKIDVKKFFDFATPSLILGLAFYRIGCFIGGCCYGVPADWGFPMAHSPEILRVPTQLIELICDIGIFAMLLYAEKKEWFNETKGILYPLFMISYGLIRFVIEFFRERDILIGTFSQAHFLSLFAIAIGIIWVILAVEKQTKKSKVDATDGDVHF